MQQTYRLGVIGNPVSHSLSPQIHQQFAVQFGHQLDYQKYQLETAELKSFISDFVSRGGNGLNVTLPHKQSVIPLLDKISDDAALTNSVNTIVVDKQGELHGDTTDGRGLLLDLEQQGVAVAGKRILVIGAGGASQSILGSLIKAGAQVSLHNRTQSKVVDLIERFSAIGTISPFVEGRPYDLVISSISEFNQNLMAPVSKSIKPATFCYDLNYAARANDFREFVSKSGATGFSDGLGMLIGQAALSYQLWTGKLPDIQQISLAGIN